MHTPWTPHACGNTCRALLVASVDSTGRSQLIDLPGGRWWISLGSESGGAYQVWVIWGAHTFQIDNVANGMHGTAMPCFPDARIQIRNAGTADTVYLSVSD